MAQEKSFTRAAARLGVTQSALSHTIRGLEERLGVRLLNRTTRSVAPTQAGERLLASVAPRLDEIEAELKSLSEQSTKPAGAIRITTGEQAAERILLPALTRLLPHYPGLQVELSIDYGLTDIVAERFDAGVRLGEQVARDMIAVPISPELRMAVVGAPSYFATHPAPKDATAAFRSASASTCAFPPMAGSMPWEFEKGARKLNVRVEGQLVFNTVGLIVQAALAGMGLACLPQDAVRADIESGPGLVPQDWPATGVRPSPATTFIIPAAASNRPPLRCWSRRCAIARAPGA